MYALHLVTHPVPENSRSWSAFDTLSTRRTRSRSENAASKASIRQWGSSEQLGSMRRIQRETRTRHYRFGASRGIRVCGVALTDTTLVASHHGLFRTLPEHRPLQKVDRHQDLVEMTKFAPPLLTETAGSSKTICPILYWARAKVRA